MHEIKLSKLNWEDASHGYFRKKVMEVNNASNKVCKVQFVKIPPNQIIKPHAHKGQTESEYVLAGSGIIKSGKQVLRLRPGLFLLLGPENFMR
ncbi:MAG: hypothetical protein PHD95_04725 [Candidatus ainarchaeum sp.]|nr:hypothetical protein [Candidatus ainarchaeum sp.]